MKICRRVFQLLPLAILFSFFTVSNAMAISEEKFEIIYLWTNRVVLVLLILAFPVCIFFLIKKKLKHRREAKENVRAMGKAGSISLPRAVLIGASLFVIGVSIWLYKDTKETHAKSPWADMKKAQNSTVPIDPSPTGTWYDKTGGNGAVKNRLTVSSWGTFKFEVVDFTGEVKGGYSGKWRLNGNSVHFTYDGGEVTGYKSGSDSLVFGATTFYR